MSFPERLEPSFAHHLAHGTWSVPAAHDMQLSLSPTVGAAGQARGRAREFLSGRVSPGELVDTLLMLSELVTNAVRHPPASEDAPVEVHLALADARIRAEVRDGGDGFEVRPPEHREDVLGGFGLVVVDSAASRWGVSAGRPHCVWFELDRAAPA